MRGFAKNEGEWTGKVEIKTRKKFLAVGKACKGNFIVELVSLNAHVLFLMLLDNVFTCVLIRKHGCVLGIHDIMCAILYLFAHVCV